MKKTELRKLIKEEVIGILSEILPSMLAEVVAESQVPSVEHIQENSAQFQQPVQPKKPSMAELVGLVGEEYENSSEPIRYSSDPVLNEILNQTDGGVPQAQTPAMAMAMAAEEASMTELLNESNDIQFASMDPSFGTDFESKLNQTIPAGTPQQQPSNNESFNPESSTVAEIGEVPADFISALTKNAKKTLDASKAKGPSGGISNINFES